MRKILLAIALVFASSSQAIAVEYSEGKDYKAVEQQATGSSDKIEVLEFFWYGCPHCFSFEPYISKWVSKNSAKVEFERVPVVFRPEWKVHARTYYALEEMGMIESIHLKIFEEIHKNKKPLNTLEEMTGFLVRQDVNKKAFTDAYNSFSVDGSMRKAIKRQAAFNIDGVPTVAINGKYTSTATMVGTYDKLLGVMDYLVVKKSIK